MSLGRSSPNFDTCATVSRICKKWVRNLGAPSQKNWWPKITSKFAWTKFRPTSQLDCEYSWNETICSGGVANCDLSCAYRSRKSGHVAGYGIGPDLQKNSRILAGTGAEFRYRPTNATICTSTIVTFVWNSRKSDYFVDQNVVRNSL